ncbi:MAG: beta-ketoacyl synthase N-terminal-like domain-containing protein [Calditrichaceae bacterium]
MSKYKSIDYSDPKFKPSTLIELLQWRAFTDPDKIAYTYLKDGESKEINYTYSDLDKLARAVAATLQKKGLTGARALLLYPPGLEYIIGFFGCLYAGIIAVPAYPPDPNRLNRTLPRLQGIIRDAQATLALTNNSILHMIRILKLGNKFTESLDKVPFLRKFRTTMDFFSTKSSGIAEANELGNLQWISTDDILGGQAENWKDPGITGDNLAFLQYTSGSTGVPKGVMLSHNNLLVNSAQIHEGFGYSNNSHGVIWLPIYHDMGLIGGILQPLFGNLPATLMSPIHFLQQPIRWLQAISKIKDKSIISGGPNFAYDLCVKKITTEQLMGLDLSHWDVAFSGAEPVRQQTIERFTETFKVAGFRKDSFIPCYGLAEATLFVTGTTIKVEPIVTTLDKNALASNKVVPTEKESPDALPLVSCGTTPSGQKIAIVNPDSMIACEELQIGEIWIKGDNVAQGYWNRSEESEKTFHAHLANSGEGPFLRTGDLGYLENGNLYVTGRVKDLIIIRGRNYYPQDIEYLIENCHPEIRPGCSAAFSIEKDGSERLVVVAEVRHSKNINIKQITDAIRLIVNETFDIQTHSIALIKPRTIPKTSSGKIQRHACKNEYENGILKLVTKSVETESPEDIDVIRDLEHVSGDSLQKNENTLRIEEWITARLAEALEISAPEIDPQKPFSSYGLDSAQAVGLVGDLEVWLNRSLSPTLIWDYPDIASLAAHLAGEGEIPIIVHQKTKPAEIKNESIAVIGYSLRMPGANNPDEFWKILKDGIDAVTEVPADRWRAEDFYDPNPGTPGKMVTKYGGFISGVDQFDAHFFGISPKEAVHMDPQQRLLLETTWEAFESAGINADLIAGSNTGVYIGISTNDYSRLNNKNLNDISSYSGTGNALSLAANRISYTFDLRGPSLSVDTACSSSLTAIHNACRSLRQGDSDLFIAGGVNLILSPEVSVTLSQARMLSPSGRCRSFDENADGYVRGEGCGVVLLKRLSDAVRDHDPIHAVIRGSALNQDGRSNGIGAPKGLAQQEVLRLALHDAGVSPDDIDYLESHSTGTAYGDPIEIDAIRNVLTVKRDFSNPLIIGSVKTNIGHLEAASGISGFVKTILALNNKYIPKHLHLSRLNPHIKSGESPIAFTISGQEWPVKNTRRLAGVSSFGIGGTNAHIILENAPEPLPGSAEQKHHLLTLSAKSMSALDKISANLVAYLLKYPDTNLSDLDYTLNTGRKPFNHRKIITYQNYQELIEALKDSKSDKFPTLSHKRIPVQAGMAFLFEGRNYSGIGSSGKFYEEIPEFKKYVDHCCALTKNQSDLPMSDIISGKINFQNESKVKLEKEAASHLASFIIQYAFARILIDYGVMPEIMAGYDSGEFLCAHLAGVITLEDSLKLILKHAEFSVAGNKNDAMLSDLSGNFKEYISSITLKKPSIKYISSVSGDFIAPEEAANPAYYIDLLTAPGQSDHILNALSDLPIQPIIVGFGNDRSGSRTPVSENRILSMMEDSEIDRSATLCLYSLLGKIWLSGKEINWSAFYRDEIRNKISLPTYPFERQRYWIDIHKTSSIADSNGEKPIDTSSRFHIPVWKQSDIPVRKTKLISAFKDTVCLIFGHHDPLTKQITEHLREYTKSVINICDGNNFHVSNEKIIINPSSEDDFRQLFDYLSEKKINPGVILYDTNGPEIASDHRGKDILDRHDRTPGFVYLSKVLNTLNYSEAPRLGVITRGMFDVTGSEKIDTSLSVFAGLIVALHEGHPDIHLHLIDLDPFAHGEGFSRRYSEQILHEFTGRNSDPIVAYRGRHRWTRHNEAIQLDVPDKKELLLRDDSTYLIAGSFDKSALLLAEHLSKSAKLKLILLSADSFPANENWDLWLESHDDKNVISRQIRQIRKIEKRGARVKIFTGNLSNFKNYDAGIKSMGPIRGFIFADIDSDPALLNVTSNGSHENITNSIKNMDAGFKKLTKLTIENGSDFCILHSSQPHPNDKYGLAAYAAVNHFIDSFSSLQNRAGQTQWISVNRDNRFIRKTETRSEPGINSEESANAILRILALRGIGRITVSSEVPDSEITEVSEISETGKSGNIKYSRPDLPTNYIPPKTKLEKQVVESWQNLLGIQTIGVNDDFFDLGGNSLLGTQLIAQVREQFNIELPLQSLFADPTISGITKIIDREINKASQKIDKVASMLARIEKISDQQANEMLRARKNDSL